MSIYTTRILILMAMASRLLAVDRTVCASGCDYSNLQSALNASVDCSIDSITLTSGETFSGGFTTPYRPGCGVVQLRSSRWAELPPVGTRVNPTDHAPLMATINANIVNTPALAIWAREANPMTNANLGTDVMTLSVGFATGTPFSCSTTPPPPMVAGVIYYAINVSPTTMQAALTPGGPAIDITGTGSIGTGGYNDDPHCLEIYPRTNWRITGINFTMPSGTTMQTALVRIGIRESNALAVPRNIWLDRNIVQGHGDLTQNWPSGGIEFHGSGITITDNWIGSIHCWDCEGKPLFGFGIVGPVLVENNFLGGGSIGVLIGGERPFIPGQVSTNVTIRRNYFSRPGNQMYREGAGAPTGSCYYGQGSGMFYRNTSSSGTSCSLSGRCYSCQSNNTWAIDLAAPYRAAGFLLKNTIELKEGKGVLVEGNVLEGQQASIDSQGNCILGVVGATIIPVMYLRDTTIRDNRCILTWGGISTATYSGISDMSYNLSVENNLVTGMGSPQLLAQNGGTGDVIFQLRVPKWQGTTMKHNTFRPDASASVTSAQGLYVEDDKTGLAPYAIPAAYIENNLWWGGTAGTRTASGVSTCNSTLSGWGVTFSNDGVKQVLNNAQFGTTTGLGGLNVCVASQNLAATSEAAVDFASDNSLNATSPYSASCSSGCAFSATDGGDVGVDTVRLNSKLNGVQAGVPGMSIRMALGSTRAVASYTAPNSSACTVKLYTSQTARIAANLSADTDPGPEQSDSRTGSVTSGTSRQLVLGFNSALTPLTPYSLVVTCGSTVSLATFRTLAAGSGNYSATVNLPSANTGEYSSSADMSSPISISSSTTHVIPIPSGSVRYYRPTGGAIQVLVAR